MNNWQDWVVGVLVYSALPASYMEYFVFFVVTRENQNPCDSCVSGCELKDMIDKKRGECDVKKKVQEKLLRIVGSFKICTTFATANEK